MNIGMKRQYVDFLIVVPLEEELQAVMKVFPGIKDRCTDTQFRFDVDTGIAGLTALIVQQEAMGKASAIDAIRSALGEFDPGLVVCIGIAGGLSDDLHLGDVCYTGKVIDVSENAKTTDGAAGDIDIEFSPTNFDTPRALTAAFSFVRTVPELQSLYAEWQAAQQAVAEALLPEQLEPRPGTFEKLGKPISLNGTIACGAVSKSEQYNKKLRAIDRRLLAIETESGGIFAEAQKMQVAAISIRGISDYADGKKKELEQSSKGHVRTIAALNAASFFRMQLNNDRFVLQVKKIKEARQLPSAQVAVAVVVDKLSTLMEGLGVEVDKKLRELSPEFRLQPKGYRLPLPRIKRLRDEAMLGPDSERPPIEVRHALRDHNTLLVHLPRTYPEQSLPWVIADDLLATELNGKQALPIVVDGEKIRPPRHGLINEADTTVSDRSDCQPVFIIENVPLSSKTRLAFLLEEVKRFPTAKFLFLTRDDLHLVKESEFVGKVAAVSFSLVNISFQEIAFFIQKNFEMSGKEAEVIALRLRDTFNRFRLAAHPTYFAGIPRETLSALLQANRRAELIQLATDGFLTILVAEDKSDISLSRTTRSRFLRKLAVEINVEKRAFTVEALVDFTRAFAASYDFEINSLAFITSFIEKGILHTIDGKVTFALPFIEAYLLAVELGEDDAAALRYFDIADAKFDLTAFDLYAELGATDAIVAKIMGQMESSIAELAIADPSQHILLSDDLKPELLLKQDKLEALQRRLKRAVDDVHKNRDTRERKQRLLDVAERVREETDAETSSAKAEKSDKQTLDKLFAAVQCWAIGTVLLGSGAEHLDAAKKQALSRMLIILATLILDSWTRLHATVDFALIKKRLTETEILAELAKDWPMDAEFDAKEMVSSTIDILEYSFMYEPFRRTLLHLFEAARHPVLATSIEKAQVGGVIEKLIYGSWLSDIDVDRGLGALTDAVKDMPTAPFLRVSLSSVLLSRTFWTHWNPAHQAKLLNVAEMVWEPLNVRIDKGKMQRNAERLSKERKSGSQDENMTPLPPQPTSTYRLAANRSYVAIATYFHSELSSDKPSMAVLELLRI